MPCILTPLDSGCNRWINVMPSSHLSESDSAQITDAGASYQRYKARPPGGGCYGFQSCHQGLLLPSLYSSPESMLIACLESHLEASGPEQWLTVFDRFQGGCHWRVTETLTGVKVGVRAGGSPDSLCDLKQVTSFFPSSHFLFLQIDIIICIHCSQR